MCVKYLQFFPLYLPCILRCVFISLIFLVVVILNKKCGLLFRWNILSHVEGGDARGIGPDALITQVAKLEGDVKRLRERLDMQQSEALVRFYFARTVPLNRVCKRF